MLGLRVWGTCILKVGLERETPGHVMGSLGSRENNNNLSIMRVVILLSSFSGSSMGERNRKRARSQSRSPSEGMFSVISS